jgi:hypothetical protein
MARRSRKFDTTRARFEALTRPAPAAIPPAIARALEPREPADDNKQKEDA